MHYLDAQLSQIIFQLGQAMPKWVVVLLATYLIWAMGILVFFFINKKSSKCIRVLFIIFLAASLAYAANFIIGHFFFRMRPFEVLGMSALIDVSYPKKSFPSDHAAVAWTAAVYIFFKYKKSAYFFIALAVLVSLGRVLAGVHYVSDVAAGALVAAAAVCLVLYSAKRMNIRT